MLSHGELWVDVRDYGAKSDGGITDNSGPIQAAIDALSSKLAGKPILKGVVFIPSASLPYMVTKSIWVDAPNIEIQGEGWGSQVQMNGGYKRPVFIFGIRRVEQALVSGQWVPVQIDSSNRPDLYGKLDTSAAPVPGNKWGIRTNGTSFVHFQANSMSSGPGSSAGFPYLDNWTETSKLTLEFCIEPPDGQAFPPLAPLLGMGNDLYETSPVLVYVAEAPDQLLVSFETSDIGNGLFKPNRAFTISLQGALPPYRIALQFDLDNAIVTAFLNGVQMPFTSSVNLAPNSPCPFIPGTGLRFSQNEHYPFLIGSQGWSGLTPGSNVGTGIDLRLYGLRLSNTIRYQNNGAGQTQRRIDAPASTINDAYAYFGNDANTICFLAMTDDPATSVRAVTATNGNTAGYGGMSSGFFLNTANLGGVIGNAIRDIAVQGAVNAGQTICLGGILEMTIDNVMAIAGFNGIGSLNTYANYTVYIQNSWIEGYDAPYFGMFQLSIGRNIYFGGAGRVTMRYLGGSADWGNILVARASPVTECIVKIRNGMYGGNFSFSSLLVDFEGETLSLAAIYCEAAEYCPAPSLRLTDIFLGTLGQTASAVMLRDGSASPDPNHLPCWLVVDNLQSGDTSFRSLIDVDGPLWRGDVKGGDLRVTRLTHEGTWGNTTNVVVRDTAFTAPPRTLHWYNGAHVLEVRSPAAGQYAEWRCTATGDYGTPTPPVWAGLNPVSSVTNALACYVLNHAYLTAALN